MLKFTPEELQLIVQMANNVDVKGLQGMQAVLSLASKCQAELNNLQAQQQAEQAPGPEAPEGSSQV